MAKKRKVDGRKASEKLSEFRKPALIAAGVVIGILTVLSVLVTVIVNTGIREAGEVTRDFLSKNPEAVFLYTIDNLYGGELDEQTLQALLLAKYIKGTAAGSIDGSFKGRFAVGRARSLEKVNLSCVDRYEYKKIFNFDTYEATAIDKSELYREEQQFKDEGCEKIYVENVVSHPRQDAALWKCPLHNCQMREVVTEFAGDLIPESIEIKRIQAEGKFN